MQTILLIVIVIVVIGIIGGAISFAMGSAQSAQARERFQAMTLGELRASEPPAKLAVGVTQKTVFGNERAAWFEALLERTFADGGAPEDRRYLQAHYAGLLRELRGFLVQSFPGVWRDDAGAESVKLVLGQADAFYAGLVEQTIAWLGATARRQNALSATRAGASPDWNAEFLIAKLGLVPSAAPLAPSQHTVETACTLPRLDAELRRLGADVPATAADAAPVP